MTQVVLCDIEGTIGPVSFVRDVLFPYAARHLPAFVRNHREDPEVGSQLQATAELGDIDPGNTDALIEQLLAWIASDTKATPLKALQGMVWKQGYENGELRSFVYEDAHHCLQEWRRIGLVLAVFSSGSVAAQKLYFRHSNFGDMRLLFSSWFDTTTGAKDDPDAYQAIADGLDVHGSQILFLSDNTEELDAATTARLRTTWIIRPEDSSVDIARVQSTHPVAETFDEVLV